jgi:hypothetical protein
MSKQNIYRPVFKHFSISFCQRRKPSSRTSLHKITERISFYISFKWSKCRPLTKPYQNTFRSLLGFHFFFQPMISDFLGNRFWCWGYELYRMTRSGEESLQQAERSVHLLTLKRQGACSSLLRNIRQGSHCRCMRQPFWATYELASDYSPLVRPFVSEGRRGRWRKK